MSNNSQESKKYCPNKCNKYLMEKQRGVFKCPECYFAYCENCQVKYHKGMSCREYQKQDVFKDPSNFVMLQENHE